MGEVAVSSNTITQPWPGSATNSCTTQQLVEQGEFSFKNLLIIIINLGSQTGRFLHSPLFCCPCQCHSYQQHPLHREKMTDPIPGSPARRASTARTAQPIKLQTASRHSCNRPPSKHFVLHTEMRRGAARNTKSARDGAGRRLLGNRGGFATAAARQETKSVKPVGQMINISGIKNNTKAA